MLNSDNCDTVDNKDYVRVNTSYNYWPSLAACDKVLLCFNSLKWCAIVSEKISTLDEEGLILITDIIRAYKELVLTTASHVTNQIKNSK
jgi:hypothetical protein